MEVGKTQKVQVDGSKLKIAIVLPYFNEEIGLELLENAQNELLEYNVRPENIEIFRTAGALEIPFACLKIAEKLKPNAIITLGVVIRGETAHYDQVCNETYRGLMDVQIKTGIPISFGVLTCENEKQARARASLEGGNKGAHAALSALIQTTL